MSHHYIPIGVCQHVQVAHSKTVPKEQGDKLLATMIKKDQSQMRRLVLRLAKKNNPRLPSQIRVEDLLRKHTEFDSRGQLFCALRCGMKAGTLNTIIARLVQQDRLPIRITC